MKASLGKRRRSAVSTRIYLATNFQSIYSQGPLQTLSWEDATPPSLGAPQLGALGGRAGFSENRPRPFQGSI